MSDSATTDVLFARTEVSIIGVADPANPTNNPLGGAQIYGGIWSAGNAICTPGNWAACEQEYGLYFYAWCELKGLRSDLS